MKDPEGLEKVGRGAWYRTRLLDTRDLAVGL